MMKMCFQAIQKSPHMSLCFNWAQKVKQITGIVRDKSSTDVTFVYGCRWGSSYFPYFGSWHVGTSVVTPHSCHNGLFKIPQQLFSVCSLLEMFSLSPNAFFELLELVIRLVSPQVLQPLGCWAGAGGGSALSPAYQAWSCSYQRAWVLAVHAVLCFAFLFCRDSYTTKMWLVSHSPQDVQGWLVTEVADVSALESQGICAVQVFICLFVPGVSPAE